MKNVFGHSLLVLSLVFLWGCSTKKDRLINRTYHSLTTKYNVLFNGQEALNIGIDILESQAQDDFNKILPIELITLDGEKQKSGFIPSFTLAEEKAVKAIQVHSMNLNGHQKNNQIVRAYLLLGKSRYYDGRFIPAIESFNYLLSLPSKLDVFYEGKLWREKTNIRLGNNQLAIANLRPITKAIFQKNKNFAEVNATLAQAFLNIRENDSALKYIKQATKFEKKKLTRARYRFIKAQLFELLNQKDSAKITYRKIVNLNRKVPRIYWMHAKLNLLAIDLETNTEKPEKEFQKLTRSFENQNFLHLIYRQQAKYYLNQGKNNLAKKFYAKSFQSPNINQSTRRQNYRDLADNAFAQGKYLDTGFYLDSLLTLFSQENNQKKQITRERKSLDEVIIFEKIIQDADEILFLSLMNREEQLAYYQKVIADKREAELSKLKSEKKQFFNILGQSRKNPFYFYNENLLVLGKQDFATKFGSRSNVDNWNRIEFLVSNNTIASDKDEEKIDTEQDPIIKETAEFYVDLLPKDPKVLDSLFEARNQAYLRVGIIYKERFKDNTLAETRFKTLLSKHPSDNQKINAWYHLYKMKEDMGNQDALIYKNKIIANYPESRFARILKNPNNFKLKENETPEMMYEGLYALYLEQEYEEVLIKGDDLLVILSGDPFVAKILYLMANAFGRLDGINVWKEKLSLLVKEFPNSEEAKQANKILTDLANFSKEELGKSKHIYNNYKLIFPVLKRNKNSIPQLINSITEILDKNNIRYNSVTEEVYNREYIFLIANGLKEKPEIVLDSEDEKKEMLFNAFSNKFVLLSSKYKDIQLLKKWNPLNNAFNEK